MDCSSRNCFEAAGSARKQAQLRALVETSPAAIVTLDQHGVIKLANQAAVDLMMPAGANLLGQPIATFIPELQNALRPEAGAPFRTSMQCEGHRGNGETFVAEVWFSTYQEKGAPKLAAITADVSEEQTAGRPVEGELLRTNQLEGLSLCEVGGPLEINLQESVET